MMMEEFDFCGSCCGENNAVTSAPGEYAKSRCMENYSYLIRYSRLNYLSHVHRSMFSFFAHTNVLFIYVLGDLENLCMIQFIRWILIFVYFYYLNER